jgi:hypothetical protein
MEPLWNSDVRFYIGPLLMAAGLRLLLVGARRAVRALRLPSGVRDKNLRLMTGFRLAIEGPALAGVAAGWLWNVPGVLAIAAIIGAGELLETSLDAWALRRQVNAR